MNTMRMKLKKTASTRETETTQRLHPHTVEWSKRLALAVICVGVSLVASRAAAGVPAVAVDYKYHGCAVTETGGVRCWGENGYGAVDGFSYGDGVRAPVDVIGLPGDMKGVATADGASCAFSGTGVVYCWGWNKYGELGRGSRSNWPPLKAGPVSMTDRVMSLTAGRNHFCALTTQGTVRCWGGNYHGQLGIGTTKDAVKPATVTSAGTNVRQVVAGEYHTCAVTSTGGVKCWGHNYYGQLGDGTTKTIRLTPVTVSGLTSRVSAVSAGGFHTCAVLDTGEVKCWGSNSYFQLGDGTETDYAKPHSVPGLTEAIGLAGGYVHTCALRSDRKVFCWGGEAMLYEFPTEIPEFNHASSIAAGNYSTCAVIDDTFNRGVVRCTNGHDHTAEAITPIEVPGFGAHFTCKSVLLPGLPGGSPRKQLCSWG